MGSRPRLPNNVIDGLEAALALTGDIWGALRELKGRAERVEDTRSLAAVSEGMDALAGIEHHLRNARRGVYEERQGGTGRIEVVGSGERMGVRVPQRAPVRTNGKS